MCMSVCNNSKTFILSKSDIKIFDNDLDKLTSILFYTWVLFYWLTLLFIMYKYIQCNNSKKYATSYRSGINKPLYIIKI